MMSSVEGLFLATAAVRLSSSSVTLQEGDEIRNQEKPLGGFQLALRRATDRQQGIIKAIQEELIECLVDIRRCQVGIQSDGLVGFGDRQLIFAGARQGETRRSIREDVDRAGSSRPTFPMSVAPVPDCR